MKSTKFWLYLQPFVFIFENINKYLIYNSYSKNHLIFRKEVYLNKILKELNDPANNYCIQINQTDLNNPLISKFINRIKNSFSGDILLMDTNKCKPFIFYPKKNIQVLGLPLHNKNAIIFKEPLRYLQELTIYLNGQCNNSCLNCEIAYKQIKHCHKSFTELDLNSINIILSLIKKCNIRDINLIGGNIFIYPYLKYILNELEYFNCNVNIYISSLNIDKIGNCFKINDSANIFILVNLYSNDPNIFSLNKTFANIKFKFMFILTDQSQLEKACSIIKKYKLSTFELVPIYNLKNYSFIKSHLFYSISDIKKIENTKAQIFSKMVMNIFNFGHLFISSDRKVYSNLNFQEIGTIDDQFDDIINRELNNEVSSWLKIRKDYPCCECIYQYLCPSPHNYEYILNKPNLCFINN